MDRVSIPRACSFASPASLQATRNFPCVIPAPHLDYTALFLIKSLSLSLSLSLELHRKANGGSSSLFLRHGRGHTSVFSFDRTSLCIAADVAQDIRLRRDPALVPVGRTCVHAAIV